jgi:pyruvate formate lyase activating enzyme
MRANGNDGVDVSFDTMMERSARCLESGVLFDVKRFALHDGPGIRTTAFLKGCPLSCSWCHNPESQSSKPELMFWEERCVGCGACVSTCVVGAISIGDALAETDRGACTACGECIDACPFDARAIAGKTWTVGRLLEEVEKDLLFYDESGGGVTLSGGEPLVQASFVASLLAECRDRRIHTAVDTCGDADWEDLERVARATDLFLYDVKHVDEGRHRELTGVSNERILENLRRLDGEGCALWIRYPVVPDLNDADDDVTALGEFVAPLKAVEAIHLLPLHRGGERKLERLGRPCRPRSAERDPRSAADAVAKILRGILSVPVHVGG